MNNLPKGWAELPLSKIVDKIIDHRGITPKKLGLNWSINGEYRALSAKSVKTGGLVNEDKINLGSEDLYKKWMKDEVIFNDILLTSEAPMGEVIIWKSEEKIILSQRLFAIRIKEHICADYIYYHTISRIFQCELLARATGTTVIGIKQSELLKTNIILPKFGEQKTIADILSSFDNKIELLNEQNKTLETMAQATFKEWFVDNKNDNWNKKPLSEIADFLNGLACQKFPPKNNIDKLPVLKIKELKNGISNNSDWATIDVKNEYIVHSGDVIFAWSASLIIKIWNGEKSLLNQHLFKVTSEKYPKWFYFQWCKYHLNKFISIAKSKATTIGHIKRGDLDSAMCFIPVNNEIQKLDYLMSDIMKKNHNNNLQIQTLQNTRDTLLPKLMSGKLRVKGFEN
jgi:type I restriction enzyme S subunit